MQITLSFGLDRLKDLPVDMRQEIQRALNLPVQAVATETVVPHQNGAPPWVAPIHPVYQPQPQIVHAPQVQQPVVQPEQVPTKQPVIQGNTKVFLPDRNHPSQQNAAIDVMTGQPTQVMTPPSAPVMPQIQNAPVNVTPVATTGPVQMNLQPQADVGAARAAAVRLYNDPSRGGNQALQACLAAAGMTTMAELSDATAGALYHAIQTKTGRV